MMASRWRKAGTEMYSSDVVVSDLESEGSGQ